MNKIILDIKSGFVSINGASLYYEKSGEGNAIVLVHGMGLDCRMWDDQFLELASQFQVIRYDLRGFGKSSLPSNQSYSHHKDLNDLLKHLNISKASLIGLSMGARVVLDFALTFPEMPSSLILVDAVLHGYTFKSFSLEKIIAVAKESGVEGANKAWLEHELFNEANKIISVANSLNNIISSYSGWHWLNKNPWTPLEPPSIEQAHKIKIPTLIVIGQFDLPDFHIIADILSKKISNSQKIVISNVGHMSNMENPVEFNQIVIDFLTPGKKQ